MVLELVLVRPGGLMPGNMPFRMVLVVETDSTRKLARVRPSYIS